MRQHSIFGRIMAICAVLILLFAAVPVSAATGNATVTTTPALQFCGANIRLGGIDYLCAVDLGAPVINSGSDTVLTAGTTVTMDLYFNINNEWYAVRANELQGDPSELFTVQFTKTAGSELVTEPVWKVYPDEYGDRYYLEFSVIGGSAEAVLEVSVALTQPDAGNVGAVHQIAGICAAQEKCIADFALPDYTGPCTVDFGSPVTSTGDPANMYNTSTICFPLMFIGSDNLQYAVYSSELQGNPSDLFSVKETITDGSATVTCNGWKTWDNGHWYLEYAVIHTGPAANLSVSVQLVQETLYRQSSLVTFTGAAPANLIANPGFDIPTGPLYTTDYVPAVWFNVDGSYQIGNEASHTGTTFVHLLYANYGANPGPFPCVYQDVAVEPNSVYRLTFWARHWIGGDAIPQPLYYGIRNPKGADVWAPVIQHEVTLPTDFIYYPITLEFATGDLDAVRVFTFAPLYTAGGAGGYQIDTFSLEYVRAEHPEVPADGLIKDGSFNNAMTVITDGTLSSEGFWTSMSWANTVWEYPNAYAGAGLANMTCSFDGLPAGEFPTIYQDVPVLPNSIYRLSFYARCWNPDAPVEPLYYGYRDPAGDVWVPVEQYAATGLGTDYQKITMEFDTKTLSKIRVFAFTEAIANHVAGYHLDNFLLEYVGQSTPALAFTGASLTIENGISVNFKADQALFTSHGYSDPTVTFAINGLSFTATDYIEKDGKYSFTLYNIRPDWMGETITATLTATLNGETVTSTPLTYSIKQYCNNMLDDPDSATSLKTLLVDLLNYGAAAQAYTGHNADAPVNADLTDEEKALATQNATAISQHALSEAPADIKASWNSAALYLRETTRLRMTFTTELTEGLTVKAIVGGQTYTIDQHDMIAVNGGYVFYFDELTATQMRTPVELTVCNNGTPVSQTLTYSVQTYAAKAFSKNEDAALVAMLRAMLCYGDSATAYVS